MKDALRHNKPLSPIEPALGLQSRLDALLPFVECIRKHMEVIASVSVHSEAFDKAPSHIREALGKNPHQLAFTVTMMEILSYVGDGDTLNIVCDDEEQVAWEIYSLYKTVKRNYPDARPRMSGISFVDSSVFPLIQAADVVASIFRREAGLHFMAEEYEFRPLFESLCTPSPSDKLYAVNTVFVGENELSGIADGNMIATKKCTPAKASNWRTSLRLSKVRR